MLGRLISSNLLLFLKDIFLLLLKPKVCLDHTFDSSHVWVTIHMELFYEGGDVGRVLPLLHTFEQAKVSQDNCRCSADS